MIVGIDLSRGIQSRKIDESEILTLQKHYHSLTIGNIFNQCNLQGKINATYNRHINKYLQYPISFVIIVGIWIISRQFIDTNKVSVHIVLNVHDHIEIAVSWKLFMLAYMLKSWKLIHPFVHFFASLDKFIYHLLYILQRTLK